MKISAVHFTSKIDLARKSAAAAALAALISCCATTGTLAQERAAGSDWPTAAPKEFGIDAEKLAAFDSDIAAGKYGLVDSMLVLRCGTVVYDKSFHHDYGQIYGERAKKAGPLNHDPQGPYNYFSTVFHPFYQGGDLHTM